MTKETNPEIPPEEIIDYFPIGEMQVLLEQIDALLEREYLMYLSLKSKEMSQSTSLLERFLGPDETITKLCNLGIGDEFILVTKYPRTKESDKIYTINYFFSEKERKKVVKYVHTTTGKKLPAEIYVVRNHQQRAKSLANERWH